MNITYGESLKEDGAVAVVICTWCYNYCCCYLTGIHNENTEDDTNDDVDEY